MWRKNCNHLYVCLFVKYKCFFFKGCLSNINVSFVKSEHLLCAASFALPSTACYFRERKQLFVNVRTLVGGIAEILSPGPHHSFYT